MYSSWLEVGPDMHESTYIINRHIIYWFLYKTEPYAEVFASLI